VKEKDKPLEAAHAADRDAGARKICASSAYCC